MFQYTLSLFILYMFQYTPPVHQIIYVNYENSLPLLQHTKASIVDWYNFHRDIYAQYLLDHSVQIGGPGIEVEIDESKFGRWKYNHGRWIEGH